MNETSTRPEFDPHARNGAGQHGHVATTPAGISRWRPTAEAAIRAAEAQEAAYRYAGVLDDVIERISPAAHDPAVHEVVIDGRYVATVTETGDDDGPAAVHYELEDGRRLVASSPESAVTLAARLGWL